GINRKEDIHPGLELDESELAPCFGLIALVTVKHDPSRYVTCELAKTYFMVGLAFYSHSGAFVISRRFFMPSYEIFSGMILFIDNLSRHRITADMHIKR